MRITAVQFRVLSTIHSAPGQELAADKIAGVTQDALLRKGLIEACSRLYFGPRSLRYCLTADGKKLFQ
jgi:hypothetical protein